MVSSFFSEIFDTKVVDHEGEKIYLVECVQREGVRTTGE